MSLSAFSTVTGLAHHGLKSQLALPLDICYMVLEIRRLSPQQDPLCLADSHCPKSGTAVGQGRLLHSKDAHVKSTFVHFHSSYGRTRHFKCAYLSKNNRDGKRLLAAQRSLIMPKGWGELAGLDKVPSVP